MIVPVGGVAFSMRVHFFADNMFGEIGKTIDNLLVDVELVFDVVHQVGILLSM